MGLDGPCGSWSSQALSPPRPGPGGGLTGGLIPAQCVCMALLQSPSTLGLWGPPGKWEDSRRTPCARELTHGSTWRQLLLSFVKATARGRP